MTFGSFEAGSCSFCGKDRRVVRALVGIEAGETRICDACVVLCWRVLAEAVGDSLGEFGIDELPLERLVATVERLVAMKAAGHLATRSSAALACSFCGRSEGECAKLIAGPRAFICEACVASAAAAARSSRLAPTG